jgi:hypothetical protein
MASYIYNNPSQLLPVGPNLTDRAFVISENKAYTFVDLSSFLSYSYSFNGAGSLVADSLGDLDSNNFSLEFWSYTFSNTGRSYFTFDSKEKIVKVTEVARSLGFDSQGNIPILSIAPYPNYSSLYFDGVDNCITSSNITSVDILQPYTFEFWGRNVDRTNDFEILTLGDGADTIVSIRKDRIVVNGSPFTLNTSIHGYDSWEHHAITYDGYDHRYFRNGTEIQKTGTSKYNISLGSSIASSSFSLVSDAAFQIKTVIPTSPTDGTIFSAGTSTLGTKLAIEGGGNILSLTCKDLTASTSSIPKDSNDHVISWDYQIDPKRIRLFIDGTLVSSQQGTGQFSSGNWADQASKEFDEFQVNINDIQKIPYYPYYGSGTVTSVFYRMENNNLYINPSVNYFYTPLTINGPNSSVINPNGNKLYYFEYYPNSPNFPTFSGWPFIISRQASLLDNNLFYHRWIGSYNRSYERNSNGLSVNQLNFYDYARYGSSINSVIIDETAKRIYNFTNGVYRSADDFSSSNMTTPDTFVLGITEAEWWQIGYNASNETKFVFNRSEWILDPNILYKNVVGSGTSFGEYAGTTKPSWINSSNTSNLRYYPQSLKTTNQKASIGAKVSSFEYDETGLQYAQKYVSFTGGSVVTHTGSTNITSRIASLNNGDALVLPAGTYTASGVQIDTTHSSIFGFKNILICGQTNNPNDVIINYTPLDLRDIPIFGNNSNANSQLAYLTFNRGFYTRHTSNYETSIFRSGAGKLYRAVLDFKNKNVSWLYSPNYPGLTINRYVIECSFKNYSSWLGYYNGYIQGLQLIKCRFSKGFTDESILASFGQQDTFCVFDSDQSKNLEFKGHLFDVSASNEILYNSNFTIPSKKMVDSSTKFLLETERRGDNLFSLRDNGKVIVNDVEVDSIYNPVDTWIHHAISYDSLGLRIYKDGTLKSTINTTFDGFSIDKSTLKIGRDDRVNTIAGNYDKIYYTGNLKDIILSKEIKYTGSNITVRSSDKIGKDSDEIIFTGSNESPPGDLNLQYDGTAISPGLFSPYTASTKGWKPDLVVSPAYTGASIQNISGIGQQFLFKFDSTTYFDSSFSIDVYLKLINKDDLGNNIGWNYEFMSPENVIKIARKGDREFVIKRNQDVSFTDYSTYQSILFLSSYRLDSPEYMGIFNVVPGVNDYSEAVYPVTVTHNRFVSAIEANSNVISLRMFENFDLIDSTFDMTGFSYDSTYDYDRLNPDRLIRIYDSVGALPI